MSIKIPRDYIPWLEVAPRVLEPPLVKTWISGLVEAQKQEGLTMNDKAEIVKFLYDVIGEEGCGVSCSEAEVFEDERGWNMMLRRVYEALVHRKDRRRSQSKH